MAVVAPSFGLGEAIGLGVTPGVGLGTSVPMPDPPKFELRLPRIASAVPHPAISSVSATMPAMISSHGVRWAGGVGPTGV